MIRTLYDPEVASVAKLKYYYWNWKVFFGEIPSEYEEKIKNATVEVIEEIALDVFNFTDIKDLDKYLD